MRMAVALDEGAVALDEGAVALHVGAVALHEGAIALHIFVTAARGCCVLFGCCVTPCVHELCICV